MERTINEIYQLIVQKRESAEAHYCREIKTSRTPNDKDLINRLEGEIEAYTDVLCLLESSGVVEDELIR